METVVANPLAAAGDSNTIVMEPSVTYQRNWRTGLNNCNTDEETTWWGSWCCCLLHARTSQSFELDTSQKLVMCYVIYFAGLFLLMSSGLLIPFATAGGLMLVWYRAKMRSMIREKLNISGSFSGDFMTHLCCACCAVCQEAREEKITLPRSIDFCSGEDLLSEDRAHQRAIGHGEEGSGSAIPEGGNMLSHYRSISKLSKMILISTVIMAVLTILLLIYLQRPLDIVISFLVFLQPLVILYFVYWRARRQYASLDFVIKCFAVGYYITTTQSIVLELLLQTICGLLLIPFVRNFDLLQTNEVIPQSNMNNDYKDIFVDHRVLSGFNDKIDIHHNNLRSSESTLKISNHFQKTILSTINNVFSLHNSLFNSNVHGTINIYSSPTPTISWLSRYSVKNAGNLRYSLATDNPIDPNSSNNDPAGIDPEKLRNFGKDNIVIIIVGCLLMAFIVAAAVEETMKHFVVRCCRFPTQLKDPHTVLVYLMAGALGFATKENAQYVFGASNGVSDTSVFLGMLFVLALRVLMPIHVICSVMQAANLSKVIMGNSQMSLFMILLPGILLHGSFDFSLFFVGAISFIYDDESIMLTIITFAIAGGLTLGGIIYAYLSFQKVEGDFRNGYGVFATEEEDVVEVNLQMT